MAQRNSLIFLPDISGFTRFVDSTAVEHSQHIISELLELLIDSEGLGMTLAEIEGDAIFYYKYGQVPSAEEVIKQAVKMFTNFHGHLKLYENRRICQCGACIGAVDLTLKFIVHAGRMDFIQIKSDRKPYGKEVIVAHRLMKNDIPIDDYLLLSRGVFDAWQISDLKTSAGLPVQKGQSEYDLGPISYHYIDLSPLKQRIPAPAPLARNGLTKPLVQLSATVDLPATQLLELVSNLEYRGLWNQAADGFEFEKNRINRVGTKHLCIIHNRALEFETITHDFGQDKMVYGERTKDLPLIGELITYFIIEPQGKHSRITVQAHPQNQPFYKYPLLLLGRWKIKKAMWRTIENLKELAEEQHGGATLMVTSEK